MYKLQHFSKYFCDDFSNSFCNQYEVYSIWRFSPLEIWESLWEYLVDVTSCSPKWFAPIYWLALGISVMGFFYSCREFWSIYSGSWAMSTYRERNFRVIPLVFRRNFRLITAALMVKTYFYLVVGIVTVTPQFISSWLIIFFTIFCFELILWIGETLFLVIQFDVKFLCSHCMSFATVLLLRCVRDVFDRVIEQHGNVDELQLMPKLQKG